MLDESTREILNRLTHSYQRIRHWYNNATRGDKANGIGVGAKARRSVINLTGRTLTRKLSRVQMYMLLYFDLKLKAAVDEEFAKEKTRVLAEGEERRARVKVMCDVCTAMLENESPEVIEEVDSATTEQDGVDEDNTDDDVWETLLKTWDE